MPPITNLQNQVVVPIVTAITSNPNGAGAIAALMGGRLPFANNQELVSSIVLALAFQALGANDLIDRTHDHSFFDNATVQYSGPLPAQVLAAVNAGVARYSSTADARNYLIHYYEPTGNLQIPLLTVHNPRDPQVPILHEMRYHNVVAASGHSDLLVQLLGTQPYGHSNFSDQEVASRFHDLVTWVETGVKPTQ
jgi:hypothetical protein